MHKVESPPRLSLNRTANAWPLVAPLAVIILGAGFAALDLGNRLRWIGLQSIVAAVLVLLLPVGVGSAFRLRRTWDWPAELALRFLLGNLAIIVASQVLRWFGLFDATAIALISLTTAIAGGVMWWALNPKSRVLPKPDWREWGVLALALVVPVGAIVYWRWLSPPPLQPIWDGLLQLGPISDLASGEFHIWMSEYSSAFAVNAYLPGQHVRIAATEALTGVGPLYQLWGGPFVLTVATAAGVFVLLRRLGFTRSGAVLAASATPFLQALIKSPAPLINLLPASEAVALTPWILIAFIDGSWKRALWVSVLALPVHVVHGALLIGFIAVTWAVDEAHKRWGWARVAIVVVSVVGFAAYLYADWLHGSVDPGVVLDPTGSYAEVTPDAGLRERIGLVRRFFPTSAIAVAVLAAGLSLHSSDPSRRRLLLYSVVVPVGFLVPVIGLERSHALLMVPVAAGLACLIELVETLFSNAFRTRLATGFASIAVVIIAFAPGVAEPLTEQRDRQLLDTDLTNTASSFVPYEVDAVSGLSTNLEIVSDPVTMSLVEAFSTADTKSGPYLSAETTTALTTLLTADDPEVIAQAASALTLDGPQLLMITGRTAWWAYRLEATDSNVWSWEFRPRSLDALPNGPVPVDAATLVLRLRASGCFVSESIDPLVVTGQLGCPSEG